MSLSALARSAGLSKATLSELERGRGNPSIDTMWALAQALDLPFGALFDSQMAELRVRRLEDAPVISSEPGFLGRLLMSRQGRGGLEVYVLTLDAGAQRHAAPHSPGVLEHVVVVAGRVEVGDPDEPTVLGPGDCVTFAADRPHAYHSLDGPACLLSLHDYP